MARILVTGMSGAGKSALLDELGRRGHVTIDTDYDGWETPEGLWNEERMDEFLAHHDDAVISGTVDNQGRFYDRFDHVVLLSAPVEVLLERVRNRTTNPYGRSVKEQEEIRRYVDEVEPRLRRGSTLELDGRLPVARLADAVEQLLGGRLNRGTTRHPPGTRVTSCPTTKAPAMTHTLPDVPDLTDDRLFDEARALMDGKTKPVGSLGVLEVLALQVAAILGTAVPEPIQPQMVVFAGDHGLARRGVSAYPSEVTAQMVHNFLDGGAAVSVLARQHGIALTIVDCGVASEIPPQPGLVIAKVGAGTADATRAPAMTRSQCAQALSNGITVLSGLPGNTLMLGEMGIANTSSASLLMSRLTGIDIDECTGAGTGLTHEGIRRKAGILRQVLAHHAEATEPLTALAAFGGFEIAAMVGAILEAAAQQRVIVVDGFVTTAAVLVATKLRPHVLQRCVFAHRSGEAGHAALLEHLGVSPLLDFCMRLGEGSGAATAWPLIVSACAILRDMASFESAGVSRRDRT